MKNWEREKLVFHAVEKGGRGLPSSFPLKTQDSKCLYPVSHGKNNKWYVTKTNSVNAQELL